MYVALTFFALLFVGAVIQAFLNIPVLDNTLAAIERLCGRTYTGLFGWTLVFAVGLNAIAAVVAGPFVGLPFALEQVATACVLTLMVGWLMCMASVLNGVPHKRRARPPIVLGVLFITAFWGSIPGLWVISTSKWYLF